MKARINILLICLLFFIGCKQSHENIISTNLSYNITDSIVDLNIPIADLNYYKESKKIDIVPYVFYQSKQLCLLYSSDFKHVIDSVFFGNLKLNEPINAISKISEDAYYILTETKIYKINDFNILDSIQFQSEDPIYIGHYTDFHKVPFYAWNENVYLQRLNVNCDGGLQENCLNESLEIKMNFKNKIISEVPIFYPSKFKNTNFPTSLRLINRTTNDSFLIYNFIVDENIYALNTSTNELKKYNCRSKNQKDSILGIGNNISENIIEKSKEVLDFFTTASKYSRFIYDPFFDKYYRVFSQGQELKNKDSLFNTYLDRKTYIMVLNSKFDIIGEFEIDTKKYNYGIIPTSKGLAIPRRKKVNNSYQYDIIKINH